MLHDGTEAYLILQCAAQIALLAETREAPQKWLLSRARYPVKNVSTIFTNFEPGAREYSFHGGREECSHRWRAHRRNRPRRVWKRRSRISWLALQIVKCNDMHFQEYKRTEACFPWRGGHSFFILGSDQFAVYLKFAELPCTSLNVIINIFNYFYARSITHTFYWQR